MVRSSHMIYLITWYRYDRGLECGKGSSLGRTVTQSKHLGEGSASLCFLPPPSLPFSPSPLSLFHAVSYDLPNEGWGLYDRPYHILPDECLDLFWNGVWEFLFHRVIWVSLLPIFEYTILQVHSTWVLYTHNWQLRSRVSWRLQNLVAKILLTSADIKSRL